MKNVFVLWLLVMIQATHIRSDSSIKIKAVDLVLPRLAFIDDVELDSLVEITLLTVVIEDALIIEGRSLGKDGRIRLEADGCPVTTTRTDLLGFVLRNTALILLHPFFTVALYHHFQPINKAFTTDTPTPCNPPEIR
jgi:hypothetical protein